MRNKIMFLFLAILIFSLSVVSVRGIPPIPPDLTISDIWYSGSKIYYRIENQHYGDDAGASYTQLRVDGSNKTTDYVENVSTNNGINRSFTYKWSCSGASDTIEVCADIYDSVDEVYEDNNCRSETWICPTIPEGSIVSML